MLGHILFAFWGNTFLKSFLSFHLDFLRLSCSINAHILHQTPSLSLVPATLSWSQGSAWRPLRTCPPPRGTCAVSPILPTGRGRQDSCFCLICEARFLRHLSPPQFVPRWTRLQVELLLEAYRGNIPPDSSPRVFTIHRSYVAVSTTCHLIWALSWKGGKCRLGKHDKLFSPSSSSLRP